MNLIPFSSMAGNDDPPINEDESCPPSTTISIQVTLDDDCSAMENCSFEFLVFDLPTCGDEGPPVAQSDFLYGTNPTLISNVTINNSWVKVCVRLKPGTHCDYTYYTPKCQFLPLSSSPMKFNLNLCSP